jgi:hypothetical protein
MLDWLSDLLTVNEVHAIVFYQLHISTLHWGDYLYCPIDPDETGYPRLGNKADR